MLRADKRPHPLLLPFFNIPLYHRLIMRFGGNKWHLEEVQLAATHFAGSAIPRDSMDAGVQWGVLTRYGHSLQWHARTWVVKSLEDDLIDAQAKQAGHDA